MKIHTAEKPYICTVCHKGFAYKKNLTEHKKTHTGDKAFKCTLCDKAFIQNGDLKRHIRTHTGERPFKCTVCYQTFTQQYHFTMHNRMHTGGERLFKCNVCPKAFTQNVYLKKHMRIHAGKKPYICTVCNKAFTQKQNLTEHKKIHTGDKAFKCTFCDKAFMRNRCLKRHIRIHSPKTNSAVNINLPMGYQNNNDNNEAISNKINGLDIDSLDPAKVAEIKKSLEKELANFNSLETNSAVNINPPMDYQNNNNNNIYFMANNFLKIVKSLEEYHKVQTKNPEEELANINSVEANSAVNINLPMGYQNNNDNNEAISNKINGLDIDSLDHAKVAEIKESLEKELANFNSLETNSAVNINPQMDSQLKINYPYEDFLNFNLDYLPSDFDEDDTDENM